MENCGVVFDTNVYRNIVDNLSEKEIRIKFYNIWKNERQRNINAYLIPVVLLELFSHLADKNDPAYIVCKNSIIASCIHCKISEKNIFPNLLLEFDTTLCKLLFDNCPKKLVNQQLDFGKLALTVLINSNESNLNKYRSSFSNFKIRKDELIEHFIRSLNEAIIKRKNDKQKFKIQKEEFKNDIRTNKDIRKVALTILKRILSYFDKNINNINNIDNMVDKILKNIPTPFIYFRNYLDKVHSYNNYNINKKREGSVFFDFSIAYLIDAEQINNKPLYFVTDDKALTKAAEDTGNKNKVIKLGTYLNSIGI